MARYHVVTNIDSSSAAIRQEAAEQAAALGTMTGCGPAAENAILPDRHPSGELSASLTCDADVAETAQIDAELQGAVEEFKLVFGNG